MTSKDGRRSPVDATQAHLKSSGAQTKTSLTNKKMAQTTTEKPTKTTLAESGPIFIVPYGPDISLSMTRILQNKIRDHGGTIAKTAKEASIVVIDPLLSETVVKRDFLKDKMETATKVKLEWLKQVLSSGEWKNPDELKWEPSMGSRSPSPQQSLSAHESDSVASSWGTGAAALRIEPNVGSDRDSDKGEDSPRQREYEQNRQKEASVVTSSSTKFNENLIKEMAKMAEMYQAQGEKWRAKAYAQAAAILRTLDFEVTNSDQIRHRKGIGPRMAAHIDEILATGKYSKREAFEQDPKTTALVKLTKIFGVGKAIALKLYRYGYGDIENIRHGVELNDPRLNFFNRNQKIGIKYYEDLEVRMKRTEIEAIRDIVRSAAKQVYPFHVSQDLTIEAVGSFRRGKETCGDCDILMALPTRPQQRVSLVPLVDSLVQSEFIKETLSLPNVEATDEGDPFAPRRRQEVVGRDSLVSSLTERELESETFMGICLIPPGHKEYTGIHHRIDIKSYAFQAYPFALLYFTGSALFSRNMRHYANQKGLKLTDRGLYPLLPEFYRSTTHGIKCKSEEEIFHALGLEYREPKDRNYDEVVEELSDIMEDEDEDDDLKKPKKKQKKLENEEDEGQAATIRVATEAEDEDQRKADQQRFEEWLRSTRPRDDAKEPLGAASSSSSSGVGSPGIKKDEDAKRNELLFGTKNDEETRRKEMLFGARKEGDIVQQPPIKTPVPLPTLHGHPKGPDHKSAAPSSAAARAVAPVAPSSSSLQAQPRTEEARRGDDLPETEEPDTRETQWMRLMHGPARRAHGSKPRSSSSASSSSASSSYSSSNRK